MFCFVLNGLKFKYLTIQSQLRRVLRKGLFDFELLAAYQRFACLAIAKRSISCQFASTDVHLRHFLVKTKLNWFKSATSMRTVAEGLRLRHAATAPVVVLCTEDRVFYLIGSYSGRNGKRVLALICLKPPLEVSTFVLRN